MVTNLVENEVLCWAQSRINPASWINPNSCNVMDSIRLQAQRLRELEEYVDAQAGGPGKGFFHIVTTPQEARETIAAGRMAVVLGKGQLMLWVEFDKVSVPICPHTVLKGIKLGFVQKVI